MMRGRAAVYVVFFLSLSLLVSLGGWQWHRGLEKAAIERLLEDSANHYITIDRAPQNWAHLAYRQVQLEGDWLAGRDFLLANRTHHGRPGYEVFSPFRLAEDGATLLVNRGWIDHAEAFPGTPRTGLSDQAGAAGQLYLPEKGFTLGPADDASPGRRPAWPRVIQHWDGSALSAALGTALQPAAVALDPHHPGALVRIWRAYVMTAARHYAYAAQWWGLAVTLVVFGLIWRRQSARTAKKHAQ